MKLTYADKLYAINCAKELRIEQEEFITNRVAGYCFHGINHNVSWDCACGACENGDTNEWSNVYEYGLQRARERANERVRVNTAKSVIRSIGINKHPLDSDELEAIMIVIDLLNEYKI